MIWSRRLNEMRVHDEHLSELNRQQERFREAVEGIRVGGGIDNFCGLAIVEVFPQSRDVGIADSLRGGRQFAGKSQSFSPRR
jgi:hypothetical protein